MYASVVSIFSEDIEYHAYSPLQLCYATFARKQYNIYIFFKYTLLGNAVLASLAHNTFTNGLLTKYFGEVRH